jgi:hypothetical protein
MISDCRPSPTGWVRARRFHEGLDEALTVAREAITTMRHDHPDRAAASSNLGVVPLTRFETTGDLNGLDAAVDAARHAVLATLPETPKLLATLRTSRELIPWARRRRA